jgi:Stage II sporulation protein E (SpoIIE)
VLAIISAIALEAEDRLVLLSDGVLGAAPERGSAYGAGRLDELLGDSRELAPYEVARLVVGEVVAHRAGDLADDLTVVCLDWRGQRRDCGWRTHGGDVQRLRPQGPAMPTAHGCRPLKPEHRPGLAARLLPFPCQLVQGRRPQAASWPPTELGVAGWWSEGCSRRPVWRSAAAGLGRRDGSPKSNDEAIVLELRLWAAAVAAPAAAEGF